MDALLDVIGGLQVEAAGMGMPELFSAGWTDNVEDAQAQYDELIQKQKDLAQASEDATNQIIVDSIIQRAQGLMETDPLAGTNLLGVAADLAGEFGLVSEEAI